MTLWICEPCPLNELGCGEYDDTRSTFSNFLSVHKKHPGWHVQGSRPKTPTITQMATDAATKLIEKYENKSQISDGFTAIEKYVNSVVVKDPDLVRRVLIGGLSAYTSDPINTGIMATTSEGKTYVLTTALSLFPVDDVWFIGGMSPTALIHDKGILVDSNGSKTDESGIPYDELLEILNDSIDAAKDSGKDSRTRYKELKQERRVFLRDKRKMVDLSHKMLVFLESPQTELWNRLKPILSHDVYEMEFRITNRTQSSGLTTKKVIIRGYPTCFFASAKDEKDNPIWAEIESRFMITSPSGQSEKYAKANELTSIKNSVPDFAEDLYHSRSDKKFAIQQISTFKTNLLEQIDKNGEQKMINFFHHFIHNHFPHNDGTAMRSMKRLQSYITVLTSISARKNPKLVKYNEKSVDDVYAITTVSDIANAIELIGKTKDIPPQKANFYIDVFRVCEANNFGKPVSTLQLVEQFDNVYGKTLSPKQIRDNYLSPLRHYGVVKGTQQPNTTNWDYETATPLEILDLTKIIQTIKEYPKGEISKITDTLIDDILNRASKYKLLSADNKELSKDQIFSEILKVIEK